MPVDKAFIPRGGFCVYTEIGPFSRVEGRRVTGRESVAHPALSYRAAVRVPWARFLPPLSEPGVPISGTGLSSGIMRLAHGLAGCDQRAGLASRGTRLHTLALAGRCFVRPVDALTTATARVVPFACACDDVWHSCSSVGVIGRSATPGACSRSPSLPPEAPSLGRHCPASTVVRASPPPWPARPCPHGSSVGACHATGRASRVASIPLFHTCRRHYPGGTGRCSRRSLPDRWQPSPIFGRVGFRVARFEACSAFTRVAARVLAEPPKAALCHRSASADVVTSIVRSDCYRLERQLPGGIRTRWGMAPCHGAPNNPG